MLGNARISTRRLVAFFYRHRALQRVHVVSFLTVVALAWAVAAPSLVAQPASPSQVGAATAQDRKQVSLSDQLRIGLKAKTAEDKAFLDRVVQLTLQGALPRRLVDSTFLWARSRAVQRPGRNPLRPIVYFRPALTLRARRLGLAL